MRNLKFEEVQEVNGGDGAQATKEVIDGACATVAVTGVLGWAVPGLNVAKAFCAGWTVGKLIND
ncbi:hypothetical protein [Aquimarina macrocephali]|uniref:hypothetical protein n=1 Tax=Aquimarina macrocephali TaxID=666563 RepID=UPI003F672BBC